MLIASMNGKNSIEPSLSEKVIEEPADDNFGDKPAVLNKQFQCTECIKSFKYASSLQLHLKKAHGITFKSEEGATAITNDQGRIVYK